MMKYPKAFFKLLLSGAFIALLLNGCEENLGPLIPADEDPAITLIAPTSNSINLQAGQEFNITFQMADNEALKVFRVVGRIYDQDENLLGSDVIMFEEEISGSNIEYVYTDDVPSLGNYYKIRYTCYAVDSKGAFSSAIFWITVIPTPPDPSPYEVLEYKKDSIFNRKANAYYAFNFTSRKAMPKPGQSANTLDLDIQENSGTGQGQWAPTLYSPNNDFFGKDSVFVMTDATRFNYEEATYETIYQAWYSDPFDSRIDHSKTPVLKVGDYVIIRLNKSPFPQFAVMKITKVFDDGAGVNVKDYIVFDYKVTSQ